MINTDGFPTIAMKESDSLMSNLPISFKEYKDLDDAESHFLIIEVEGDKTAALDLRSLIEKHELPGLGMSFIVPLEAMVGMTKDLDKELKNEG